jgi:hypothetical protein
MVKTVVVVVRGGQNKSTNTHVNTERQVELYTHTPGTEMDQAGGHEP